MECTSRFNLGTVTDVEDSKMKVGYQFGVGMEYSFNEIWSVRPSLMLVTKGAVVENKLLQDESRKVTFNPMYLQIPVMAAASLEIGDDIRFVAKAGPYIAFGIGAGVELGHFMVNLDTTFALTKFTTTYQETIDNAVLVEPKNINIALSVG